MQTLKLMSAPSEADEARYPDIMDIYNNGLKNAEIRRQMRAKKREITAKRRRRKIFVRTINVMLAVFYALCAVCMLLGLTDFLRFIGG